MLWFLQRVHLCRHTNLYENKAGTRGRPSRLEFGVNCEINSIRLRSLTEKKDDRNLGEPGKLDSLKFGSSHLRRG